MTSVPPHLRHSLPGPVALRPEPESVSEQTPPAPGRELFPEKVTKKGRGEFRHLQEPENTPGLKFHLANMPTTFSNDPPSTLNTEDTYQTKRKRDDETSDHLPSKRWHSSGARALSQYQVDCSHHYHMTPNYAGGFCQTLHPAAAQALEAKCTG